MNIDDESELRYMPVFRTLVILCHKMNPRWPSVSRRLRSRSMELTETRIRSSNFSFIIWWFKTRVLPTLLLQGQSSERPCTSHKKRMNILPRMSAWHYFPIHYTSRIQWLCQIDFTGCSGSWSGRQTHSSELRFMLRYSNNPAAGAGDGGRVSTTAGVSKVSPQ